MEDNLEVRDGVVGFEGVGRLSLLSIAVANCVLKLDTSESKVCRE